MLKIKVSVPKVSFRGSNKSFKLQKKASSSVKKTSFSKLNKLSKINKNINVQKIVLKPSNLKLQKFSDFNEQGNDDREMSKTRVFLGGVPFQMQEGEVSDLFGEFGDVTKVTLPPLFQNSSRHRGFGFIEFADGAAAANALEMDGKTVNGRVLSVRPAFERPKPRMPDLSEQPEGCTSLFLGNISYEASENDLRNFLEQEAGAMGRIGLKKGYGFLNFETEEETGAAAKALHGSEFFGRRLRVDFGRVNHYSPQNNNYNQESEQKFEEDGEFGDRI